MKPNRKPNPEFLKWIDLLNMPHISMFAGDDVGFQTNEDQEAISARDIFLGEASFTTSH